MRVAILGGTGLLGRHTSARLRLAGHDVFRMARHSPAADADPSPFLAVDVRRLDQLEAALDGVDAVVSAFGSLRQTPDQSFHDVHFRGAQHVVAACRSRRVRRVIHVSSLGARAASRSAFHRTKSAGEDHLRRSLLDVTVLRPSAMYGPDDDFVTPLARLLRRLPVAPYPGRGQARVQPVAADDVAAAIAAAIARDDTAGHAFDVPGPETLGIATIYDRVLDAIGLRRRKIGIPYLLIEPLTHLASAVPGVHFSFDHLAFLEEERPGDIASARARLAFAPRPFDVAAIREALANERLSAGR